MVRFVLVLGAVALVASPSFADGKTTITGWNTYQLGTASGVVAPATVSAPIEGRSYRATLTVERHQGKVGAVLLHWRSFDSADAWFVAAQGMIRELGQRYDGSIWVDQPHRSFWERRGDGRFTMTDADGNRLLFTARRDRFDMTLLYLWGPYDKALSQAPKPVGNY
jgi:hypothetical protein